VFANLREDSGLDEVARWLEDKLQAPADSRRALNDAHAPYAGTPRTHGHGHGEHEHSHGFERGQTDGHH
jgi:hypothetical protein